MTCFRYSVNAGILKYIIEEEDVGGVQFCLVQATVVHWQTRKNERMNAAI